jgi:flagellar motor switch protein FliN/FliY
MHPDELTPAAQPDAERDIERDAERGAEPSAAPTVEVAAATFPDVGSEHLGGGDAGRPAHLGVFHDVELDVTVELGRRQLPLADVLRLGTGSVIELEKMVGEPLAVYANGRLIAEGEAVVVDEQFGVRITRLATPNAAGNAFH